MEQSIESESAEPFALRMEKLHARADIRLGSIPPETGVFLHSLIRLARPSLCVELGAFHGVSTLWMAQALKENGKGELYSFDLFEHSDPAGVTARLVASGLGGVAHVFRAPSSTGAINVLRKLGRPIDFVFIDADHRVEAVGADLMAFWPLLKAGALLLLHDTNAPLTEWDGPAYALKLMRDCGAGPQSLAVVDLPTPEGRGLAILQKLEPGRPRILPWPAYLAYQWRTRMRFWLRGGKIDQMK